MSDHKEHKKSSKKERDRELRDDGFKKRSLIDYSVVMDRPAEDKRFERERTMREQDLPSSSSSSSKPTTSSSTTFDAFKRMAAGLEGRTLADKISDPNRPTWEQYKKDNEDKLDMVGGEAKKMVEYRAELDRERERRLKEGGDKKHSHAIDDSDNDDNSNESDNLERKSSKKKSSKHKKSKKHKKSDKSEKKSKKHKRHKKNKKKSDSDEDDSNSNSSNNNSNEDDDDDDEDDNAPRSIITGKKIKMKRDLTYEDRMQEIDRAAKRHFMNTQY